MAGLYKKNPFSLPDRVNPSSLDDEYDRKKFKLWISELSIGNVSNTARSLHAELNRLNHLEMSPVSRFEALEMMLPSLVFVLEKLESYLISVPIPLSKKNRLVSRLHLELIIRSIVGYKTVLAQFHDDTFTGYLLHKNSRSESIRRALYFLGYLLCHEYSVYKTTPKYVWKEIHGFYFYAVSNELNNSPVDTKEDDPSGGLGITDLYKQVLMLGLADPNGMLKGEVRKVHETLPRWLAGVSISSFDNSLSSPPLFVINAQKDLPPQFSSDVDLSQIKKGWFLDTGRLIQLVQQEVDELKDNGDALHRPLDAVSLKLLNKLITSWGKGIFSREKRHKRAGIIDVTCGLNSLFLLFGGGQIPNEPEDKVGSPFELLDLDNLGPTITVPHDEYLIDADGQLGSLRATEPATEEEIELDILNDAIVDEIDSQECISVNESKRGCYLTWPGEGEYKAHVGEVIGINPRDNLDLTESWALGIIRWLRIQSHGLMGFGVELIGGESEPARLERIENGTTTDVMLAFKLIADDGSLSVITHPLFISSQDRFELVTKDDRVVITPGSIIECTDAIMRFEATLDATGSKRKKRDDKQYSVSEDPFSTIWDKLQI